MCRCSCRRESMETMVRVPSASPMSTITSTASPMKYTLVCRGIVKFLE